MPPGWLHQRGLPCNNKELYGVAQDFLPVLIHAVLGVALAQLLRLHSPACVVLQIVFVGVFLLTKASAPAHPIGPPGVSVAELVHSKVAYARSTAEDQAGAGLDSIKSKAEDESGQQPGRLEDLLVPGALEGLKHHIDCLRNSYQISLPRAATASANCEVEEATIKSNTQDGCHAPCSACCAVQH